MGKILSKNKKKPDNTINFIRELNGGLDLQTFDHIVQYMKAMQDEKRQLLAALKRGGVDFND